MGKGQEISTRLIHFHTFMLTFDLFQVHLHTRDNNGNEDLSPV